MPDIVMLCALSDYFGVTTDELLGRNKMEEIAVCDDEPMDRQQAEALTTDVMTAEGLVCSLSSYESATALLTAIQGGAQFHILLLDVMMEGLDGMELAAALRKLGDRTAIIFISSNREMALRGYEVSAARYLADRKSVV